MSKEELVKDYYGKELKGSSDLKTNACKLSMAYLSKNIKAVKSLLHGDTLSSFYGCGSPIPPVLHDAVVLDLGCGSGVDVFVCSALVGDEGRVIGVDMTDEQLEKANKYVDYHFQKFKEAGYISKPNVEFKKAYIEDLSFIPDNSIDIIISNCVINLSSEKPKVFKECHRILKQGGELYFSDVYANKRIPIELQNDKVLWGECLSGSMYIEDFRRLMEKTGFVDHRVCSSSAIVVNNPEIQKQVGDIIFYSNTVRAFKLALEDRCEDYGQVATYNGSLPDHPHAFFFDDHHTFITDYSVPVCGNTADMLSLTRYAPYFSVTPRGQHRGIFDCGGKNLNISKVTTGGGSCC
jgi:ubiquinone/menaquinone biosynthesis C-methylase UbiE